MKSNKILLEATVIDAYKVEFTHPPSESVELEYDLDPKDYCDVFNTDFDESTSSVHSALSHTVTKGWFCLDLPEYHGLKPGDKLRISLI